MKYKIILTLFTFISSCSFNSYQKKVSRKIQKAEENIAIISASDSFYVYKTRREFIYKVEQKIDNDSLFFNLKLQIIPNKNKKSAYVKYLYYYNINDIKKYKTRKDCKDSITDICYREITSINEMKGWVLIHPPRSYTLELLELAPFPEVIENKKKWNSTLIIPKGSWGEWEDTTFDWLYTMDSIQYHGDSIPNRYNISSVSKSKFGTNTNNYIFQKDSGFVDMKYSFENEGTVHIKLIEINDSYL